MLSLLTILRLSFSIIVVRFLQSIPDRTFGIRDCLRKFMFPVNRPLTAGLVTNCHGLGDWKMNGKLTLVIIIRIVQSLRNQFYSA